MKKLCVLLLVMACAMSAVAQTTPPTLQSSGTSAFCMVSGWSEKPFQKFEGGIRAGLTLPLESERGLYLRTAYQSLNIVGGENIQTIEVTPLLSWYIGTKWEFYLVGGLTGYVGGENSGIDATGGFGFARRVWTQQPGTAIIPASIDLFTECSFTDAGGQPVGGRGQINFGLRFNRDKK